MAPLMKDAPRREVPLVSVIMNCYNGAKYLREAIESVLAQSYEHWELVFWDNQSVDDSARIFESYKDPRLRYHYAPEHSVLYSARNHALDQCHGELIAFLDVDDWWLPEKLQVQVPMFSNEAVGMSCGNYFLINERRKKSRIAHVTLPFGDVLDDLFEDYFVHFSTFMARRRAIDSLDRAFDPRFSIIGDFDLVVRMSLDWELASVQRPIACYRWHQSNLGRQTGFLFSDELNTWYDEVKDNAVYRDRPSFAALERKIRFQDVMKELHAGRRREAFRRLKRVPRRQRLKAMLALLLPVTIVRRRLER